MALKLFNWIGSHAEFLIVAMFVLAMGIILSSCAETSALTKFTVADVTAADDLAKSISDQQGQICWETVLPIVTEINSTTSPGFATGIELSRAVVTANVPLKCNGIIPFPLP